MELEWDSVCDISKMKSQLNYIPTYSISEGLTIISIVSSTSGYTKTEAKEVWRLPPESNGDIRINL